MTAETEGPGTYLVLYLASSIAFYVDPADYDSVEANWAKWVESGRTVDRVLSLSYIGGAPLRLLASSLVGFSLSTPETRRVYAAFENAMDEEEKELSPEPEKPFE